MNLSIDGKTVVLNDYVKDFIVGTIQGAISPLHDIKSDWSELEIMSCEFIRMLRPGQAV